MSALWSLMIGVSTVGVVSGGAAGLVESNMVCVPAGACEVPPKV